MKTNKAPEKDLTKAMRQLAVAALEHVHQNHNKVAAEDICVNCYMDMCLEESKTTFIKVLYDNGAADDLDLARATVAQITECQVLLIQALDFMKDCLDDFEP